MSFRSAALLGFGVLAIVSGSALSVHAQIAPVAPNAQSCPTHDCVAHRVDTQSKCTEEVKGPQGNAAGWHLGLAADTDRKNYGGTISAYQIQWSNGAWSGWFVKGVNDLDGKVNPSDNTMRRQWSYFADHTHKIIVCR